MNRSAGRPGNSVFPIARPDPAPTFHVAAWAALPGFACASSRRMIYYRQAGNIGPGVFDRAREAVPDFSTSRLARRRRPKRESVRWPTIERKQPSRPWRRPEWSPPDVAYRRGNTAGWVALLLSPIRGVGHDADRVKSTRPPGRRPGGFYMPDPGEGDIKKGRSRGTVP